MIIWHKFFPTNGKFVNVLLLNFRRLKEVKFGNLAPLFFTPKHKISIGIQLRNDIFSIFFVLNF